MRLAVVKKVWIFLFLQLSVALTFGLTEGETLRSSNGRTYIVEFNIGYGTFGEAWRIKDKETREVFVIKVYRDKEMGAKSVQRIDHFLSEAGENSPFLKTFSSETFTDSKKRMFTVNRSELAQGSLEEWAESRYQIKGVLSEEAKAQRLEKISKAVSKGLKDLRELHQKGYVHRDLNPGNLLIVNHELKFSDLDSVVAYKTDKEGSPWELFFAPIEYENLSSQLASGPLGDYFTLAGSFFFGLTGKSPIELYAEKKTKGDMEKARKRLHSSEAARSEFQEIVKSTFKRIAGNDNVSWARYLEACLEVDPKERQGKLLALNPELDEVADLAPKTLLTSPSVQEETPSCQGKYKKLAEA